MAEPKNAPAQGGWDNAVAALNPAAPGGAPPTPGPVLGPPEPVTPAPLTTEGPLTATEFADSVAGAVLCPGCGQPATCQCGQVLTIEAISGQMGVPTCSQCGQYICTTNGADYCVWSGLPRTVQLAIERKCPHCQGPTCVALGGYCRITGLPLDTPPTTTRRGGVRGAVDRMIGRNPGKPAGQPAGEPRTTVQKGKG